MIYDNIKCVQNDFRSCWAIPNDRRTTCNESDFVSHDYEMIFNYYETICNDYETICNGYETICTDYETISNDYEMIMKLRKDYEMI